MWNNNNKNMKNNKKNKITILQHNHKPQWKWKSQMMWKLISHATFRHQVVLQRKTPLVAGAALNWWTHFFPQNWFHLLPRCLRWAPVLLRSGPSWGQWSADPVRHSPSPQGSSHPVSHGAPPAHTVKDTFGELMLQCICSPGKKNCICVFCFELVTHLVWKLSEPL